MEIVLWQKEKGRGDAGLLQVSDKILIKILQFGLFGTIGTLTSGFKIPYNLINDRIKHPIESRLQCSFFIVL
jgi:hypothetical protein